VGRREKLLLSFLFLAVMQSHGQAGSSNIIYTLSAKAGYTSIWTGRESLQQFTQDHPWSVQFDFGVLKNTTQAWNYCNCYSENGVSLGYINFANPEKLGRALTVAAFTEPYLVSGKHFQLSLRGTAGFAFLNKVYDSIANKDAIFFSTKLSFVLGLGLNVGWRLNQNWRLTAAAQFNHISNAGRKDPNEGMNFPGVNVGVNYTLHPQQLEKRTKERFADKNIGLLVHGFGNIRTAWADANWPEEKRLVTGANIGLIKRLGRIEGLGVGGEYYYDGINEVYQQRSGETIQNSVGGLSIQNYLLLGKLLFGQQFAWYVTPNTGFQKNIYQRYLLEFELKKNWYAGFTLKAHGDHSDYFAFSTGYFFKL
jgi:hypothetical protein